MKYLIILILFCFTAQERNKLNLNTIESKFKYRNIKDFKIDDFNWSKRTEFYATIDSLTYRNIYQDSSIYYARFPDLEFYYSIQETDRNTIEITTLYQREGEYCDNITYLIYNRAGELLNKFSVARQCGDGIYWNELKSRFINTNTILLTKKDNWKTPDSDDLDQPDIVTTEEFEIEIDNSGELLKRVNYIRTDTIK